MANILSLLRNVVCVYVRVECIFFPAVEKDSSYWMGSSSPRRMHTLWPLQRLPLRPTTLVLSLVACLDPADFAEFIDFE